MEDVHCVLQGLPDPCLLSSVFHLADLSVCMRYLLSKVCVKIYFIMHGWHGSHFKIWDSNNNNTFYFKTSNKPNIEFLNKVYVCLSKWIVSFMNVSFMNVYKCININLLWYFNLTFWNIWIPTWCEISLWLTHKLLTLMYTYKISVMYWYHMTLISTDDNF